MISSPSESQLPRAYLAARAATLAAIVPFIMRLSLPNLARFLEPRRPVPEVQDPEAVVEGVLPVLDYALTRGQPVVRPGCLTRGVTRYWFLRRAGVPVSLVFGTGRVEDGIEAHCWVALDDAALAEPDDGRTFTELVRICAPGIVQTERA